MVPAFGVGWWAFFFLSGVVSHVRVRSCACNTSIHVSLGWCSKWLMASAVEVVCPNVFIEVGRSVMPGRRCSVDEDLSKQAFFFCVYCCRSHPRECFFFCFFSVVC